MSRGIMVVLSCSEFCVLHSMNYLTPVAVCLSLFFRFPQTTVPNPNYYAFPPNYSFIFFFAIGIISVQTSFGPRGIAEVL